MLNKKQLITHFTAVALASLTLEAIALQEKERILIAPNCLLAQAKVEHQLLSSQGNLSLISIADDKVEKLITAKHQSKTPCGGFRDVTSRWQQSHLKSLRSQKEYSLFLSKETSAPKKSQKKEAYAIRYQSKANELIQTIQPETMWNNLTTLTQFKDRYAGSDNGVKAAHWFKKQIEEIAKATGHDDVTVRFVETGRRYKQPSVVAKFGKSNEPGIVIGAHMDTLSSTFEIKPGADDDGSGSVTVLETARTLLTSHASFGKPIYFIWYAAEEEGLIGSDYVVQDFQAKNIPVSAVIHFDMTGYAYQNEPTIWLINDNVNKELTKFLEKLINTYVKQPVNYTKCGYACSDHASWHRAGFSASFPFEAQFGKDNKYIHTSQDTIDHLSLKHMTDYVKLGVAFAVELAEPKA